MFLLVTDQQAANHKIVFLVKTLRKGIFVAEMLIVL
jgi:hypothetical protein